MQYAQNMWKQKNEGWRNSESLSVFIVKDVNGGLVALPEIIVTISNWKIPLEKKVNLSHQIHKYRSCSIQSSSHLWPFEVIQPSPYFDDPAIVKPRNTCITILHFVTFKHRTLDASVVAAPDLPVVYRGGVLHIQSYSPSGETPFQLSQGAALFAAVCLQGVMNSGETMRAPSSGYSTRQKKNSRPPVWSRGGSFSPCREISTASRRTAQSCTTEEEGESGEEIAATFYWDRRGCTYNERDVCTWWMCRMYGSSTQTSVSRLLMYGLNRAP